MPSSYANIPLPHRGNSDSRRVAFQPAFGAPVRWTLIVLSWLAFGVASYLAFHSVTGTSVAGCGVGDANGCDVVLSSSWSRWLGVPVAVLGLACYASLASLSVLLGLRSAAANRWITTAYVTLAIVAAGASLWFIGVQIVAIGNYCKYCLVTDACGIILGIVALAAAVQCMLSRRGQPQPRTMQPGLMALCAALPAGARAPGAAIVPPSIMASPPSLLAALAGALPLLVLLIGGQLLFAAKTFQVEQLALNDSIKMDGASDDNAAGETTTPAAHVALRIPSEEGGETGDASPESKTADATAEKNPDETSDPSITDHTAADPAIDPTHANQATEKPVPPTDEPARERVVKFLGGKLSLDVYKHPLIGSPEAPHIVVEMVSYDCPHCRKMHAIMEDALARYGNQVALLVMPVPLDKDCNKLVTDEAASHLGAAPRLASPAASPSSIRARSSSFTTS